MSEEKTKGLNGNQLKLIAIAAMTLDHLVCVIFPNFPKTWWIICLHIIGRIAAPTFWFMVAEGYFYTKNIKAYLLRLGIFAVISHFAYNFAFGIPFVPFKTTVFNQTSVIWALFIGVLALTLTDQRYFNLKHWQKVLVVWGATILAFCADWSCIAVLAIVDIYYNRGNLNKQVFNMMKWVLLYVIVYFLFIDKVYGLIQLGVILVFPLMANYNGQRGKWKGMKWFFYIYYPLHLVICGIIRIALHGNTGVLIGA